MATDSSTADACRCVRPTDCVDRGEGRYLVAAVRLTGGRERRVRTGEVSDRVGVAPASVTEAFDRLADDGLVAYEKRAGVRLTERGREVALELAWRQCTVRTFFRRETGHELAAETAYRIGYTLPETAIERLRDLAGGSPRERCAPGNAAARCCPHGVVTH